MPSPTTINPNAKSYSGPNVSFDVSYNIDGNNLTVALTMAFIPFDFRQYKWNLFNNTVDIRSLRGDNTTSLYTNNEMFNWIKNTIYNYVPFGLCMANENGLYNSFESASFVEIDTWDLINFTHTYGFGPNTNNNDIIERTFRDKSMTYLSSNDAWYSTVFGQSFNFTYALNANKFFSFYKPANCSEDFDDCLLHANNGDERLISENLIWDAAGSVDTRVSQNVVKISATTTVDRTHDRTYAVVAANPFSREIYTRFIYIEAIPETPPQPQYSIEYIEDSIQVSSSVNRLRAECDGSANNININIRKENSEDTGWQNLRPRISLKVRKIQI